MIDQMAPAIDVHEGYSLLPVGVFGSPNFKQTDTLLGWDARGTTLYTIRIYAAARLQRIDALTGACIGWMDLTSDAALAAVSAGPSRAVIMTKAKPEGSLWKHRLWNLDTGVVLGSIDRDVAANTVIGVPEDWRMGAAPQGYDAVIGSLLKEDPESQERETSVDAVSVDGSMVLTGAGWCQDQLMVRGADGTLRSTMQTTDGTAISFATFSLDGGVVVGLADGSVACWDISMATWRWRTPCHERFVAALERSPDGRTFFTYGRDDRLCAIGEDGRVRWSVALRRPKAVALHTRLLGGKIISSPDGARVAVQTQDALRVLDASTGAERSVLDGHLGPVACLAFSRDGRSVASGGWDGDARVHNLVTGETEWVLEVSDDEVSGLEFLHDGSTLRTCGRDGYVTRWSLRTGFEEQRWPTRPDAHLQSREARDGSRALVWSGLEYALWSDQTRERILWSREIEGGNERNGYWPGGGPRVSFAAFSRDPARVLIGLRARPEDRGLWRLETLDAVSGQAAAKTRRLFGWLLVLQELDDDTVAVLAQEDDVVIVSERRKVPERRLKGALASRWSRTRDAQVSRDGRWVALQEDRQVDVWDLAGIPRHAARLEFPHEGDGPTAVSFAPDGTTLAIGTRSGCVRVFALGSTG
ncbi:MAG: WD40 repeat domain-containing protein [Deltaproteobacteria bacterium]|nr:WD40 repeat domain-containing protein [Myxococcales bacterium]MDP3213532.1 WD40 repeat domain-containing protein [Deltaproteobacteria bacterium]